MRYTMPLLCTLALAGCTAINSRDFAPTGQWTTSKGLDDATTCVVAQMNAAFASSGVNHAAVILAPGQSYEVKPTRDLMAGGEPYVVRLSKVPSGTDVTLFSIGVFGPQSKPAIERCL